MLAQRQDWSRFVEDIVRSRHYTWIGNGLGGCPVSEALPRIVADILHICHTEQVSWQQVYEEARRLCEREEAQAVEGSLN